MRDGKILENPVKVKDTVEYSQGAIVSRELVDNDAGSVTAFAFDAGQKLSEHSAPFDALVNVVEGEGEFKIAGIAHKLSEGQAIIMPANVPHAVRATSKFKMLLTMICGKGA